MTDPQAIVFEALARGRLIFPFKDELRELRSRAKSGPLIDAEQARMEELESAFERVKAKDAWFHAAMQSGDHEGARQVAEQALEICQEVA